MPSLSDRLSHLRSDIDAIDIAIHDLIVKRATIVEEIGQIKVEGGQNRAQNRAAENEAGPALRPGREATILRGLAARHRGLFPLPALVRIWREMMGAFTRMQAPLTAAVYAPAGHNRLIARTRDHYGSLMPLAALPSASACVRAVADGTADLAVLPLPADGEAEPWWPMLMGSDTDSPEVVARLPFVADRAGDDALVVAPWPRDGSAEEASLIALHLGERASRSRIIQAMTDAGLTGAVWLATTETRPDDCFHVIEVAGQIAKDDGRIVALEIQFGSACLRAGAIGGYARPLVIS